MLNWSTDEEKLKKENPREWRKWRLTQLIEYGLDEGEKINKQELLEFWDEIKNNLEPYKKRLMEFYLWGKMYSLPPNMTFWNTPPILTR